MTSEVTGGIMLIERGERERERGMVGWFQRSNSMHRIGNTTPNKHRLVLVNLG